MTLSLAIAIIVLADLALIAGLAYSMSHARRLTPHVSAGVAGAPATAAARATAAAPAARARSQRRRRTSSPLPVAS
jgi:hypothetical protein